MILEKIVEYKKEELEHFKRKDPLEELKERVRDAREPIHFGPSLKNPSEDFAIIAEIKKKSPSKGIIREDFDPVAVAKDYVKNGAAALSVLTDEHFFGGDLEHLRAVRQEVTIPLLRKDFIWDPHQVYAAREAGADAILLIVAMLEKHQLEDLTGLAEDLGLSVMVEVHDGEECETASSVGAKIIGVNNRDLRTFKVDVGTSERLFSHLASDVIKVSESGIDSRKILEKLKGAGADAFLIGEAFMKEVSPGVALRNFLKREIRD